MNAVKESKKSPVVKIKDYWVGQPKKRKQHIGIVAGVIVLIALAVTVFLNVSSSGYKILYSGLDASESAEIYAALQEMNAKPMMSSNSEVMVPTEQYNSLLLQLAAKGYPKSTLAYDVFYSHSGLTTTEFEQKQTKLFQLQDRMQDTLKQINGVQNAVVNIDIPSDTDYVWQQATTKQDSSASVLLTLKKGMELGDEEVSAIKNLVAAGTPKLSPENVKVVNAATSLELGGSTSSDGALTTDRALKLEQQYQTQLETKIEKFLSARYGSGGVKAAARVTLDFDKMIEESKKLLKQDDGKEVITHKDGSYTINGDVPAEGLTGEEDNTDIPSYVEGEGTGDNKLTSYKFSTDYDYGYIKQQVEKGAPAIKNATISVMVNDDNLAADKEEVLDLISKSTDIPVQNISLTTMNAPKVDLPTTDPTPEPTINIWNYALIGAAALMVLFFIFIMIVLFRRKAKRTAARVVAEKEVEMEDRAQTLEDEINQYKRQLEEQARASSNPKDDAIADEVRGFAKDNPEITANLLRSWLKEDE